MQGARPNLIVHSNRKGDGGSDFTLHSNKKWDGGSGSLSILILLQLLNALLVVGDCW